jgi:hypothetical protein
MIGEWWTGTDVEGSGRGLILEHYPSICLEGLRKIIRNLSQDSCSPGQDLKPGPPEYEAGVLTRSSAKFGRNCHTDKLHNDDYTSDHDEHVFLRNHSSYWTHSVSHIQWLNSETGCWSAQSALCVSEFPVHGFSYAQLVFLCKVSRGESPWASHSITSKQCGPSQTPSGCYLVAISRCLRHFYFISKIMVSDVSNVSVTASN